jgi:hypothetical protein
MPVYASPSGTCMINGSENPSSPASDCEMAMPVAATASNFYVAVYSFATGDPISPSGATLTVSLEANGSATSLSCSVSTSAMACSNTGTSVSLSAGELFGIEVNSPDLQDLEVSVSYRLS